MSIAHTQLNIFGVVLLYFTSLCGTIITGQQSLHAGLQKVSLYAHCQPKFS